MANLKYRRIEVIASRLALRCATNATTLKGSQKKASILLMPLSWPNYKDPTLEERSYKRGTKSSKINWNLAIDQIFSAPKRERDLLKADIVVSEILAAKVRLLMSPRLRSSSFEFWDQSLKSQSSSYPGFGCRPASFVLLGFDESVVSA